MKSEDFTKYERARILGARALQIAMNAPLLIKIEQGLLFVLIPIALQRLGDNTIFGLDFVKFENWSTVSSRISSAAIIKIERLLLLSVMTILPPLRSSDIALSIFSVKFILFIIEVYL